MCYLKIHFIIDFNLGKEPADTFMDEDTAALFPDEFEKSELGLVPKGWAMRPLADAYDINPTFLAALRDTLLPRLISGRLHLPEAEAFATEACV